MKRIVALVTVAVMLIFTACGKTDHSTASATLAVENENAAVADTEHAPVEETGTVEITVPAQYESITTQEEADDIAEKNGYDSAVLNEDGSLTIVMSHSVHKELMNQFVKVAAGGMKELIGSTQYPNITAVTVDDAEYSHFTITTESESISEDENYSGLELIMYGTLYHIYSGNDVDNIHVDYVNAASGEVIDSLDSGSLKAIFENANAAEASTAGETTAVPEEETTSMEELTTGENTQETEE